MQPASEDKRLKEEEEETLPKQIEDFAVFVTQTLEGLN